MWIGAMRSRDQRPDAGGSIIRAGAWCKHAALNIGELNLPN